MARMALSEEELEKAVREACGFILPQSWTGVNSKRLQF